MNMTQIAPTTRAEINERLRDAIQRPNGARWRPSWPGARGQAGIQRDAKGLDIIASPLLPRAWLGACP